MDSPEGWSYYASLAITAVGGWAGVKVFGKKIIAEIRETRQSLHEVPLLAEKIGQLTEKLEAWESAGLQSQIADNSAEIKKLAKELLEMDATMLAYFAARREGVVLWDAQGKAFWANPEASRIIGCSKDDLIGDGWRSFIHAEDAHLMTTWDVFVAGRIRKFESSVRFVHGVNGGVVTCSFKAARDRHDDKNYTRIVGILTRAET